jgi:hypothetical protein
MTSDGVMRSICEWCGETFARTTNRGPMPKYCSAAHRQAAHRARQTESMGGGLSDAIAEALAPLVEAHQKQLADAVAPFLEAQQQQWAEMMRPVVEAQQQRWAEMMAPVLEAQSKLSAVFAAMAEPPAALAAQFAAPVKGMQEQLAEVFRPVTEFQRGFAEMYTPLVERHQEWAKQIAAALPKVDTSVFDTRLWNVVDFKAIGEAVRPSLDWTKFASELGPKLDTSVFERVASTVDRSVLDSLIDGLGACVLDDIAKSAGLVRSDESGDEAAALEAARVRAALVLLGVLLVAMCARQIAAGAADALQTVWFALELLRYWENNTTEGWLAVKGIEACVGAAGGVGAKKTVGTAKKARNRKRTETPDSP